MPHRTSVGESGLVPPAAGGTDDSYQPNNLNQYSSKTNYTARVVGTVGASSGINVAVASAVSTNKVDRAWGADIVPGQGASSATTAATVYAAIPGNPDVVRVDNSKSYFIPPSTQNFGYDADGNLTSDGVWTYGYDAENRLVSMTTQLPANAGHTRWNLSFAYDYLGRRVQKTATNPDNATLNYTRRYLYNGWNLVAELDGTGSALKRSYTWGLDLAGSFGATGGVGALMQITDHAVNKNYFAAYDHNGNVVALVNDSGALAAGYEYSAFGEPMRADVLDATVADNPWRYSTKYTDVESGLVYYGLRYYSPTLGRFINKDPIAEAGGLNLYGFCGNNPVNGVDILGLKVVYQTVCTQVSTQGDFPYVWDRECTVIAVNYPDEPTPGTSTNVGGGLGGSPGGSGSNTPTGPNTPNAPNKSPCAELRSLLQQAYIAQDIYANRDGGRVPEALNIERLSSQQLQNLGQDPAMMIDDSSSFYSGVYLDHNTGKYFAAFRGTQEGQDWGTDFFQAMPVPIGLTLPAAQYQEAATVGTSLGSNPNFAGKISGVGHSLGASLDAVAALRGNFHATNFNPAGVSRATAAELGVDLGQASRLVTAYSVPGDIISQVVNRLPGIPGTDGQRQMLADPMNLSIFGVNRHMMSNVISSIKNALKQNGCN